MTPKTLFFCTAAIFASAFSAFAGGAYAVKDGDAVKIGNDYIERTFKFNGGCLITESLSNKISGKTISARAKQPDIMIPEEDKNATGGYFKTRKIPETKIQNGMLECEVGYRRGDLEIKRIFKIFDDSPAISCDIYFKGKAPAPLTGKTQNFADKRNIESVNIAKERSKIAVLDMLDFSGKHWKVRTVEFFDATDHNNNLVFERNTISYRENSMRGNLLFAEDAESGFGYFVLKEAPCSSVQLAYPGADFITDFGRTSLIGAGIDSADISESKWTRAYGYAFGVWEGGEFERLCALRKYQKNLRKLYPKRDEMVMMNTWGDRAQDTKVTESFCLNEIRLAAKMGITHFQIDDGWQEGKSANSAYGGSFKNIWSNPDYWTPSKSKYPEGLGKVSKEAKERGVELCLWFNPSAQENYADWQKDAEAMNKLYDSYGIRTFKIDGLHILNHQSQGKIRAIFDAVLAHTNNEAVFNVDATAGRRGGYFFFTKYGNIFLENRYTDWQNYYPYWTLRNLWMLSKYVPAERLQIEFLNNRRNADKYGKDLFAPKNYDIRYLFAITMAAQPLAWMEASGLDGSDLEKLAPLIKKYNEISHNFHSGIILPIGEEPDGKSWTGFQSVSSPDSGWLLVYRENNPDAKTRLSTFLPAGTKVSLAPVLGEANSFNCEVGEGGKISIELPDKNSFALFKYKTEKSN